MSAPLYLVPDEPELPGFTEAPGRPEAALPPLPEAIPSLFSPRAVSGPGEYPYPAAPAPAAAPADDEAARPHPPGQDGAQDTGEHPYPGAEDDVEEEDVEGEYDEEQEPAPRALTLPDLRPYADVRAAAGLIREYGPGGLRYAWTGTKWVSRYIGKGLAWTGRILRSAIAAVLKAAGTALRSVCVWCHEGEGPAGFQRAGMIAAGCYFASLPFSLPGPARFGLPVVWFLGFLIAGGPAKEEPKKTTKGKGKGKPAPAEAPVEVSKEAGPPPAAAPSPAPRKWFTKPSAKASAAAPETPVEDPEEDLPEGEETPVEELPEGPEEDLPEATEETPVEASADTPTQTLPEPPPAPPAPPSREALIRAYHHLYAGGSGVLLTTLRDHLSLPSTRALTEALAEAGIRWREGVRSPAGNSRGIHRADAPPLPPAQETPMGSGVGAGQGPTTHPTTTFPTPGSAPQEGMAAPATYWTPEDIARGYRLVRDPEAGPAAWKVENYTGPR
ncbi:hypothetical protein [Streptomyces sp. G1]|uniref:hypothetical protein n=1 Tax=Streptomyces sp. G1 TaxID=361572 RepID=UPI00202DBD56|nr:hypothetical protein [Streptomyces sp. G1]MCM1964878.1 hypothetical protein [Streptomyces sp. G1]